MAAVEVLASPGRRPTTTALSALGVVGHIGEGHIDVGMVAVGLGVRRDTL
jgi:hypothetical protein